jgi:hypothetical protein
MFWDRTRYYKLVRLKQGVDQLTVEKEICRIVDYSEDHGGANISKMNKKRIFRNVSEFT